MQNQGDKIQNLIIKIGYTQQAVAKMAGYKQPSSLSKAIGLGKNFTPDKLKAFSKVLGVKVKFLRDNTYTYLHTDEIPEWALLPKDAPAPNIDPLAALVAEYIHRKTENRENPAFQMLAEEMARLADEMKQMRAEFKRMREEGDGEHDPD